MLKHLDLFTGIGGFKIAAGWAGFETTAFCEISDWCDENALRVNWPEIHNFRDISEFLRGGTVYDTRADVIEFNASYGPIDLVTAGVPCQPASIIGKRKGVEDSRWLWPDTFRVVEALSPRAFVGENPIGILTLDGGDRFAEIIERFQKAGYGVWWETIPASAVGAGHRRERVWIVAYACGTGLEGHAGHENLYAKSRREFENPARPTAPKTVFPVRHPESWWKDQFPLPLVVDGVPDPAFYKEAVIATGNAIVPQAAYQILKPIAELLKK